MVARGPGPSGLRLPGGHKLAGALADFAPRGWPVAGRRCLDAGASTGGFTDVLLRAGAAEVVAVDVGYGQLAWALQQDPRVRGARPHQRPRRSTAEQIGGPVDLVVGDLSFISLTLVLDALLGVTRPDGDLVLMVKPQFEVGKERLGKGGVVRARRTGRTPCEHVAAAAAERGWGAVAGDASARCRARPATSSSSCGCGTARARCPGRRSTTRGPLRGSVGAG